MLDNDKIKLICITGGVGSGKSRISKLLSEEFGYTVLDSDRITKEMVMVPGGEGFEKIVEFFGDRVCNNDGSLNREKLSEIVFSDRESLEKLNSFSHPATIRLIKEKCEELYRKGQRLVFVESAIPFDAAYQDFCDGFWYVYAKRSERIGRLTKDRGYSREKCLKIMKSQPTERQYRAHASLVINNGDGTDGKKILDILKKHLHK